MAPGLAEAIADAVDSLVATGTSQTNAYELRNAVNRFTTVASGTGARLFQRAQPGDEILVYNGGANALLVYPDVGASIDGGATNAAISVPAGMQARFVRHRTTVWSSSGESADGIVFTQSGTGAVTETIQEELRKTIRASQFGGADLGVQITNAINSLPATGGIVDCSDLRGAQSIPSKVTVTKANVTFLFGAATFTLSGVAAIQSPFGAQFLVTAANVWFLSTGGTVFKLGAGAEADCIVFYHGATLGGVRGIEFDGNMANNTSIVDDSFQSAIPIISHAASGATVDSRITVENCVIHDFNHYGSVTYGDLSGGNTFKNNRIYSNGKADANGTGDGIFLNKGSGNNLVEGNHCYSNRRSGIRECVVGVSASNNKIIGNWCYSNTNYGIQSTEESAIGSTSGTGQTALLISKNHCYSNTKSGIIVGTYDSVGFIKNGTIEGNFSYSNTEYGIIVQSNAHATNNTRQMAILGNEVFSNTLDGILISADVLDTSIYGNTVIGNANQIVDLGTRTLTYGNKTNITDAAFDLPVGQIKFPATQNASTGANTLDDYEEGTWTPTDGSGASLSFTLADCQYLKIGQFVIANFGITYPVTANGAGVRIAGLPFTSQTTSTSSFAGCISFCQFGTALTLMVDTNASTFVVFKIGATQVINSELSTLVIRGSVFYRAAA